jgi:hypothetical protein
MPRVKCPECNYFSDLDDWNEKTQEYGRENDKEGDYGGEWDEDRFVVCPRCEELIDVSNMENADYEDDDDDW